MPITSYTLDRKLLECLNEKETEVTALPGNLGWCILAKPGWHNSTDASNTSLDIARCFCYRSCFIVVISFPEVDRVKSHSFNLNHGYVKSKSAADILFAKRNIFCLVWWFLGFFSFSIIIKKITSAVGQAVPFITHLNSLAERGKRIKTIFRTVLFSLYILILKSGNY